MSGHDPETAERIRARMQCAGFDGHEDIAMLLRCYDAISALLAEADRVIAAAELMDRYVQFRIWRDEAITRHQARTHNAPRSGGERCVTAAALDTQNPDAVTTAGRG